MTLELAHIFPVMASGRQLTHAWTTYESQLPPEFAHVYQEALADKSLGVHKVSSKTKHALVTPPPPASPSQSLPTVAWEALYPTGSVNPSAPIPGGFGFYLCGPEAFAKALPDATEVIMSYSCMFEREWEWVKGGKLPGIYGGVGPSAYGCTGGRSEDRCRCFNFRLMWRKDGDGEIYAYVTLNEDNVQRLLEVPPQSKQNPDYGFSVGREAFRFAAGRWTTVAQRVRLNTPGQADGELQLWVDGKSVISVAGLRLRDARDSHVQGLHFQTFFGGHSEDWAPSKDVRAWFANVSGAILSTAA